MVGKSLRGDLPNMLEKLKPWMPIIITVAGAIVTALTPQANAFWSMHPTATIMFAGVLGVVKNLLPSPIK